ncbi:MAG TPA: ATP-dependent Clp protease ATP-binding subunit, partial [Polyangiaceae bacterium]
TAEGSEEIASELKLALSRGELPCIGATTSEEYKRTIDADAALARRFTLVEVEEPSREDAFLILAALAPKLGEHHGVRYSEPALALSVAWSLRYLPGRALPDKTVSILDLAGARARRRGAASVESEAVAEVVAELSGVPIERLLETDVERMLRLEQILEDRVVGHTEQIGRIARILRRNAAGLGSRRPIGTFLLLGPTGVGKTETAKAIAEALFHSDSSMTRLDMSEYAEPHAVARLIGSPPGYVGHEAGGQLSEAVRRRPYQVILLDEIEKAHPEVLTAFLAVFDEGRLTDGRGRTVDFTNTVIVMTSNIGVQQAGGLEHRRVGFGNLDRAASANQLEQHFVAQARKTLSPELYNRIDEVLAFAPLDSSALAEVAQRLLMGVAEQLRERHGVHMDIDPETVAYLFEHGGFEPSLGARPLRRAIARLIEAGLAEKILQGELRAGDTARVRVDSGTLRIESSGPNG